MNKEPTFGNGKICYLEIPATDVSTSVAFYEAVFNWHIRRRGDGAVAFDDGVGEVSGTWVLNRQPHDGENLTVHIMVDNAAETVELIKKNGGEIVGKIDLEAREITVKFKDPAGNILGIYQHQG